MFIFSQHQLTPMLLFYCLSFFQELQWNCFHSNKVYANHEHFLPKKKKKRNMSNQPALFHSRDNNCVVALCKVCCSFFILTLQNMSTGKKPSDKHLLHCTPKTSPSPAVHFKCKHLYISSLLLCLPVSLGQMSILAPRVVCLSSLTHCFTGLLLHYLWVRLNNRMSEGARKLKCAI